MSRPATTMSINRANKFNVLYAGTTNAYKSKNNKERSIYLFYCGSSFFPPVVTDFETSLCEFAYICTCPKCLFSSLFLSVDYSVAIFIPL